MCKDREIRLDDNSGIRVCLNGPAGQTDQRNVGEYPEVINGDDPEKSAEIKRPEVKRRVPNIEKNAPNQEPGEYEKKIDAGPFKLDLRAVTRVYQQGSVVRSWLVDLCRNIFEHEDIASTSGKIDSNGEGEWTVRAGHEFKVDVRVIEDAVKVRAESVHPRDQKKFSNKLVALMRQQFGGHAIHKK